MGRAVYTTAEINCYIFQTRIKTVSQSTFELLRMNEGPVQNKHPHRDRTLFTFTTFLTSNAKKMQFVITCP
jgi:hypothetical protein